MNKPFSQRVRLTLDHETYQLLKQYSVVSRRSLQATAAGIITDFIAQRAEIGDGLPTTDKKVKRMPILQETMMDMERRIAATLNTQGESLYAIRDVLKSLVAILEKRS